MDSEIKQMCQHKITTVMLGGQIQSAIWFKTGKHPEFGGSLKLGKKEANERVERSLYQKANGYSYDAVKIFMPKKFTS
jgi:hypothetical protein